MCHSLLHVHICWRYNKSVDDTFSPPSVVCLPTINPLLLCLSKIHSTQSKNDFKEQKLTKEGRGRHSAVAPRDHDADARLYERNGKLHHLRSFLVDSERTNGHVSPVGHHLESRETCECEDDSVLLPSRSSSSIWNGRRSAQKTTLLQLCCASPGRKQAFAASAVGLWR